jgi:Astacin (Peptidase family M12A)
MNDSDRMRAALNKIAELARDATKGATASSGGNENAYSADVPGCTIKSVPRRLLRKAADNATRINPVNAPMLSPIGGDSSLGVMDPLSIAVMTAKYWGPTPRQLTVSFMESTPADLRARILAHMNAWTQTGCISFVQTNGTGNVRISREGNGYWSFLGTDIMLIPSNRPTMNLQGFSMTTPESEYHRVVRHETGHTLGFPHEHMRKELVARIDPQKAYPYFLATQGWDKAMVDAQVLTPLDDASIMGTPADQTSIMCYQLPGSITKDGQPIIGGVDIDPTDFAFNGRIYPKPGSTASSFSPSGNGSADDWSEAEDVDVSV